MEPSLSYSLKSAVLDERWVSTVAFPLHSGLFLAVPLEEVTV